MRASIFVPLLAFAAQVTYAAIPPACLLQAVNTQDNPADMSAICSSNNATEVQSAIASMCSGAAVSAAQSAFIASCSVAGESVAPYTATATATGSGSYVYTTAVYNSSCHCTQTIVATASGGKITGTGSVTNTASSGAAVSTAGAVHNAQQHKRGNYAAAAIALVGAVAAL